MKTIHILIIACTVSGMGIMITILLVSTSNEITVKTDWSSYAGGETISVSGEVNPKLSDEQVLIQIFYPSGELYNSTKVSLIDNSNLYSYHFNIESLGYGTTDVLQSRQRMMERPPLHHLSIKRIGILRELHLCPLNERRFMKFSLNHCIAVD